MQGVKIDRECTKNVATKTFRANNIQEKANIEFHLSSYTVDVR